MLVGMVVQIGWHNCRTGELNRNSLIWSFQQKSASFCSGSNLGTVFFSKTCNLVFSKSIVDDCPTKVPRAHWCPRHLMNGCLTIVVCPIVQLLFAQATLLQKKKSSFAAQFQNRCCFSNSAALHRAQLFFHQISSKLPNFLGGIFWAGDAAVWFAKSAKGSLSGFPLSRPTAES